MVALVLQEHKDYRYASELRRQSSEELQAGCRRRERECQHPKVWRDLAIRAPTGLSGPRTAHTRLPFCLDLSACCLSGHILLAWLQCAPSPPFCSFMNFSYFRTQLRRPLLDDIASLLPCFVCNNSFGSPLLTRQSRLLSA